MQNIAKKILIFLLLWTTKSAVGEYLSSEGISFLQLREESTLIHHSKSCGSFYVLRNNFSELDVKPDYLQFFSFGGEQVLKYKRKGFMLNKTPTGDLSYKTPYGQFYINQNILNSLSYSEYDTYLRKTLLISLRERAKKKLAEEFSQADTNIQAHSEKTITKIE